MHYETYCCLNNYILSTNVTTQCLVWFATSLKFFFKDGSTTSEMHQCRTASCDFFL